MSCIKKKSNDKFMSMFFGFARTGQKNQNQHDPYHYISFFFSPL